VAINKAGRRGSKLRNPKSSYGLTFDIQGKHTYNFIRFLRVSYLIDTVKYAIPLLGSLSFRSSCVSSRRMIKLSIPDVLSSLQVASDPTLL